MEKKDLDQAVSKRLNVALKEAKIAIDAVFESIAEGLANDHKVSLGKWGSFDTGEKKGRNEKPTQIRSQFAVPKKPTLLARAPMPGVLPLKMKRIWRKKATPKIKKP